MSQVVSVVLRGFHSEGSGWKGVDGREWMEGSGWKGVLQESWGMIAQSVKGNENQRLHPPGPT